MFADAQSDAAASQGVQSLVSSAGSSAMPGSTLVGGIQSLGTGAVALAQGFLGPKQDLKQAQRELQAASDPNILSQQIDQLTTQAVQLQRRNTQNALDRSSQLRLVAMGCGASLILFAAYKFLQ